MHAKNVRGGDLPAPSPICIGPRNAESMTGHTWRWIRDHASELGVSFIEIDRKRVILASELLAALERRASNQPDNIRLSDDSDSVVDELAEMRRLIARAG